MSRIKSFTGEDKMSIIWGLHYISCFLYGFYGDKMGIGLIGAIGLGIMQFAVLMLIEKNLG